MNTPFEAYKEYLAIKSHFSKGSYDYHKYNGKMNVKQESFNVRKDKLFYEKLAKHNDLTNFLVANLSENEKTYIRDLVYSSEADNRYNEWLKRQQSLTYLIKSELGKLEFEFDKNFICKDHQHPILLRKFLGKDISLETICLLLELSGALKYWNKELKDDIIWNSIKIKLIKYSPFINIDRKHIKKIILEYY